MTDITDEPVVRWMKEAGIADASHPLVEMFRKVAELARQDEREACIDIVAFHGGSVDIEAHIRSRGSDK